MGFHGCMKKIASDIGLLFCCRCLRLFGFGLASVLLVVFLANVRHLTTSQIGWLLTLTLLGDAVISLLLTTHADRWGRRRTLMLSGWLIVGAGVFLVTSGNFWILAVALTIGVMSPSGNEIGPFLAVEQASLAQIVPAEERTHYLAWYNVAGFSSTAVGTLAGGWICTMVRHAGTSTSDAFPYQVLFGLYVLIGLSLSAMAWRLSSAVEASTPDATAAATPVTHWTGLHRSRSTVVQLAALFAADAFAGGFIVQSIIAYWFYLRFHVSDLGLGGIFFAANVLSGISALAAVPLAKRIGLINTMVFTHLPSNVLLMMVPLMPNISWAVAVLLVRHLISQMDVPTRQAYVMAVVEPDERSAANGITATARSIGAAVSPALAGKLLSMAYFLNAPFFIAGGIKILYDLAIYQRFRRVDAKG